MSGKPFKAESLHACSQIQKSTRKMICDSSSNGNTVTSFTEDKHDVQRLDPVLSVLKAHKHREREGERETERETDRQTDRWTGRETDR